MKVTDIRIHQCKLLWHFQPKVSDGDARRWPSKVLLIGSGAQPRYENGYKGCEVEGLEVWNPVEVLTHIDQPTVFHSLANLMRKDPKEALRLVFN